MINKDKIQSIVNEFIADKELFLVELKVSSTNKIDVFVDGPTGITIQECVQISRAIEGQLDRDVEDFELQVSSPGIDSPLKVKEQFIKALNSKVEVVLNEGDKFKGPLKQFNEGQSVIIETERKERVEGKKKKITVKELKEIDLNDIKRINKVLSFK